MSRLKEIARRHLSRVGHDVGQTVGQADQALSHESGPCTGSVGQVFRQISAKNEPCPTVPPLKAGDSGTTANSAPFVGTSGGTSNGTTPVDARIAAATAKQCTAQLAKLDPAKPLHGLPADRWRQMVNDAGWLLDNFAQAALGGGWTIAELFGLWWWDDNCTRTLKDGWGGIADRLQGSRSLKMTADRATWRVMFTGEPDVLLRTAYPNLRPLWEPHP